MNQASNRSTSQLAAPAILVALMVLGGCAKGGKSPDTTAIAAAPTSTTSAPATAAPTQTAAPTGDADHNFLRMMSDHHKGLIDIVHMTIDQKDAGIAVADAKKLDDAQDKELDQMVTMLEKSYKDPYEPKIVPEHQSMVDDLKAKSGKGYELAFYNDIIKHHEEAIAMIDAYLPGAKSPVVKQMATDMKAAQTREITDFKAKAAKLGA